MPTLNWWACIPLQWAPAVSEKCDRGCSSPSPSRQQLVTSQKGTVQLLWVFLPCVCIHKWQPAIPWSSGFVSSLCLLVGLSFWYAITTFPLIIVAGIILQLTTWLPAMELVTNLEIRWQMRSWTACSLPHHTLWAVLSKRGLIYFWNTLTHHDHYRGWGMFDALPSG